jgi:ubiquinone/menaquinone biosynthesis C-methylase UbiE
MAMHRYIITEKREDNMKEYMKELISHLIYKTMGTTGFIRRIEWRNVLEWLDPKEGERILDIACGVGELSLKIAERCCEVHGIDISEDWIKRAKRLSERERIACEFAVGSADDLPYLNNYFDKVVCSSSLEHFKDDIKALKEMHRILKPNGIVVLTTDSFTYPISDDLKERHRKKFYVVNYYTHETLKGRFEISGFKMNRSKYLLNSRITSFFVNPLAIKQRWSGILGMVISFIAYPLCLVSDNLFGVKDKGYTLIAEGKKVNSSKRL